MQTSSPTASICPRSCRCRRRRRRRRRRSSSSSSSSSGCFECYVHIKRKRQDRTTQWESI